MTAVVPRLSALCRAAPTLPPTLLPVLAPRTAGAPRRLPVRPARHTGSGPPARTAGHGPGGRPRPSGPGRPARPRRSCPDPGRGAGPAAGTASRPAAAAGGTTRRTRPDRGALVGPRVAQVQPSALVGQ